MADLLSALEQPDEILVVDDEETILQEFADTLGFEGFTCHLATTLDDAKRQFIGEPNIGIILCDIGLSGSSGLELPLLLRNSGNGRVPSIIFCTAHGEVDIAIEALRVGATDFLTKPVTRLELVASIKRAARLRKGLKQNIDHAFHAISQYVRILSSGDVHEPRKRKRSPGEQPFAGNRPSSSGAAPCAPNSVKKILSIRENVLRKAGLVAPWDVEIDILLELLAARDAGKEVAATKIGLTVNLPQTTILRRIERLEENGLVIRNRDEDDKRRVNLQITEAGEEKIRKFAAEFEGLIFGNIDSPPARSHSAETIGSRNVQI
ncbi:MAG: response regulator [Rhodospirillales bacterium]|nr:response regulator [Rhodospirillales bacterium]